MVSAALAVCLYSGTAESNSAISIPTDLSVEDDGADMADVTVKVGSVFEWEMESNPTTGYGWYLVSDEGLNIESEFITKSDLCGAPGLHVFKISSDKKGTFTLKAEYKRQWEKVDPIKTEEITITFS
jgi:predicted secreted protein